MAATASVSTSSLAGQLRRAGLAEVDDSTRRRAEYSTDASLYRVVPQVVAFPRTVDEVVAALDVCHSMGVPLTSRGAGTSIAGNAVGTGLVLDFSRHLAQVHEIDQDAGTARIDPGIVLADLQRAARPYGLRFGPDPSTHNRCTLGGMIGNNACGSRALGYGRTSDNVVALDVITGTGERLALNGWATPDSSPTLTALRDVVAGNLATIRTEFGRFGRQVSGYSLEHLLPERGFDVTKAFVGTEGTLGVVLGATVRLVRTPPATVLVALGYADMASAADAVPALLPLSPIAVEGLDRRIVDVVVASRGPAAVPPLPRGNGWLFVELAGGDGAALGPIADRVIAAAGALDARVVSDGAETAALWRIREDGAGLASRPLGGKRSYSGWEDAAVPADKLGAYLRDFEALMAAHGVSGVPYGHFGDGCVHVRIDFPLDRPDGSARPPRVPRGRGETRRLVRRLDVRRARRRSGPERAASAHVFGRGPGGVCGDEGRVRSGRPLESGRHRAATTVRRGSPAAGPAVAPRARVRLSPRHGRFLGGGAPVHRRRQMSRRHDGGRRCHVSVLPRDAQ